jgi:uncharacterized protein
MEGRHVNNDLPDVHFGTAIARETNWRDQSDNDNDDDEELAETTPDVVAMLGFDPAKEDAAWDDVEDALKGIRSCGGWYYVVGDEAPVGPFASEKDAASVQSFATAKRRRDPIAMDLQSTRRYDDVGRMHLGSSNISKAAINEYFGREINDAMQGEADWKPLDPERKYKLLRHPDELQKAVPTFNNIPILSKHVPVSAAASDSHRPELVIGSTGTDCAFDAPYLKNSLVFWSRDALDNIEGGGNKQLSSAYSYTADMVPGDYGGEPYDGVMRNIVGNHVALVREGRAGPDVVVGDSKPEELDTMSNKTVTLSRGAAIAKGAILTYLRSKLAQDAKLDVTPFLADVTASNFKIKVPVIAAAVKGAAQGKLAKDANLDDLPDMLNGMNNLQEQDGLDPSAAMPLIEDETDEEMLARHEREKAAAKDKKSARDSETDEARQQRQIGELKSAQDRKASGDAGETEEQVKARHMEENKKAEDRKRSRDAVPAMVTKSAMDAAIAVATDSVRTNMLALDEAKREVEPYIGKVMRHDGTAAGIYKLALDAKGVKLDGVPPVAYRAILLALPVPNVRRDQTLALDAAQGNEASFYTRYPDAKRIGIQ